MSYCKEEGKDRIIFVTKEDQDEPILTKDVKELGTEDSPEEGEGLILENGEINWNCPCLGGMASGPCGVEFRDAFSCFHYSEEDPKGSDCIDNFRTMQECMVSYPDLYPVGGEDKAEDKKEKEELAKDEASSSIPDEDSQVKSAPTSEEKEELPNEEASSSSPHAESPVETAPPSSVEHKTDEIAEEAKVSDQPESKS
ncbi:mitochondrial intermembrane space import and assembly protein 40-B-like [Asterias rubens]|uniref:mitochondrial intermembrane space import and assembly protein 40-B-like n=1 Tax=Asterias rubens TaxID=7604 RepID=UPI001455CA5A|nr:mitochondrial intermembrane space import and assembly protein 40-B-like [Asterias rubens]